MGCVTGKNMYDTAAMAEDALIDAWTRFDYRDGTGPVAVYKCDDCGRYHLTSQGPMNDKLKQQLSDGTIGRQKEANSWLDKFKR
jgi:hypothetical protein